MMAMGDVQFRLSFAITAATIMETIYSSDPVHADDAAIEPTSEPRSLQSPRKTPCARKSSQGSVSKSSTWGYRHRYKIIVPHLTLPTS